MDRRVLERTVELARQTRAFDFRKLPKTLRVAIDSSPLEGAGRVEDTFNSARPRGPKGRWVCSGVARLVRGKGLHAGRHSVAGGDERQERGLDIDWNDADEKTSAIKTLTRQLDSLASWLEKQLPEEAANRRSRSTSTHSNRFVPRTSSPIPRAAARASERASRKIVGSPSRTSRMRHGRKSKSTRFNGFKRHIAADVDRDLVLACAVTPANRPEDEAMPDLTADMHKQGLEIDDLLIDRAYINSGLVDEVLKRRGKILCKPWKSRNGRLFPKSAFKLNLRDRTIECPAGEVQHFALGTVVEFDPEICDHCSLRAKCTTAEIGNGRTVAIAENELLQQRLRKLVRTPAGRDELRERTLIEHKLAHISQRQGNHARYRGVRKNTFDVRRAAAIQNLEVTHRSHAEARKAA